MTSGPLRWGTRLRGAIEVRGRVLGAVPRDDFGPANDLTGLELLATLGCELPLLGRPAAAAGSARP